MRRVLSAAIAALSVAAFASAATAQPTGAALYADNCAACHGAGGKGVPGAFPGLASDGWVLSPAPVLTSLLLNGRGGMPAFADILTDQEIANVATYVRGTFGNHADAVTPAMVVAARGSKAMPPSNPMQAH